MDHGGPAVRAEEDDAGRHAQQLSAAHARLQIFGQHRYPARTPARAHHPGRQGKTCANLDYPIRLAAGIHRQARLQAGTQARACRDLQTRERCRKHRTHRKPIRIEHHVPVSRVTARLPAGKHPKGKSTKVQLLKALARLVKGRRTPPPLQHVQKSGHTPPADRGLLDGGL